MTHWLVSALLIGRLSTYGLLVTCFVEIRTCYLPATSSLGQLADSGRVSRRHNTFLVPMSSTTTSPSLDLDGLRQRNVPQNAKTNSQAREAVRGLNAEEMLSDKTPREQRTFGRTPDGIGE